jgi:diguanylate cyclase (GGDEF)-like protein
VTANISKGDRTAGSSADLLRNLSLAAAVILVPFSFNSLNQQSYGLALIIGTLSAVLFYAAWSLHHKIRQLWRGALILSVAALAVLMAIREQGQIVIFWAYPILLLFHVVMGRKFALRGSLIFISTVVPMVWWEVGTPSAVRVLFTMLLASWFAYIFAARHERQEKRLQQLVRIDPLTGAYNRRHFEDSVEDSLANKRRYKRPISLVLFDIDHFKDINDQHGHKAGDDVLCWVVESVTKRIRRADGLFRYGGDEFIILMPQTDAQQAGQVAENLRQMISGDDTPFEFKLSLSIGVSELCNEEDADTWLKRADQALYRAKGEGRNRVTVSPSAVAVNQ